MFPSTLLLTPNPTLSLIPKPNSNALYFKSPSKSHACFAFPPNHDPVDEEARWQREEQRWLREERRWLREESRWNAERQALLQEINSLKLRIQDLERLNSIQGASVSETVGNIAKLLQALKEGDVTKSVNRIAEAGTSAVRLVVEAAKKEEAEEEIVVKEVIKEEAEEEIVVKEVISVPEKKEKVLRSATLRIGSEGDEVGAMQEALQKLGFYSGEEDMEFSSFSSGTERAVKTWQATLGLREDGIMTAELLHRLFGGSESGVTKNEEPESTDPEKGANGAPVASTDINEVETDESTTEAGVPRARVFLLGENRWEDSSRLSGGSKRIVKNTKVNSTTNCLTCRGEGRLLCMECDGTGEPNIEPQFIEWVDEGEAKCPYCEGLGYTVCELCQGKTST
ncbi:protein disulfide isomerase pTAC5, chloroplastic [Salvia hispanica]|uniref:protein disulfide isomerase pTAC5, chloroplastic n=1 Tax=Salvia hispanica TaxID=49212 RepID=UPI002009229E|nr:protein disulfide isomerase pTAC5, chloroplastic [Salvia hispanica]XP_047976700.1 protein disulfide isomerase pTAC5, chloroplastic [Salvia hispanica]